MGRYGVEKKYFIHPSIPLRAHCLHTHKHPYLFFDPHLTHHRGAAATAQGPVSFFHYAAADH